MKLFNEQVSVERLPTFQQLTERRLAVIADVVRETD